MTVSSSVASFKNELDQFLLNEDCGSSIHFSFPFLTHLQPDFTLLPFLCNLFSLFHNLIQSSFCFSASRFFEPLSIFRSFSIPHSTSLVSSNKLLYHSSWIVILSQSSFDKELRSNSSSVFNSTLSIHVEIFNKSKGDFLDFPALAPITDAFSTLLLLPFFLSSTYSLRGFYRLPTH